MNHKPNITELLRLGKVTGFRCAIAITACSLAYVMALLSIRLPYAPPIFLAVAVAISTWYGRLVAGLLAVAISTVFLGILLGVPPLYLTAAVQLGLFFVGTAAICYFISFPQRRCIRSILEKEQMRIMLDKAPIGIALFGGDRIVLRCNPAFREIYGWPQEEIVGRRPPLPESQKDDWNELLERLRAGKTFVNVETVRERKDGSKFYARISGSPVFDSANQFTGFVGFIAKADGGNYSDQLELRNLESLVQSASDFMSIATLGEQTLFVNDPGKEMVGMEDDEAIDETTLVDYFADEDRQRVREILTALTLRTVGLTTQTLRLKHFGTGRRIATSCSFYMIVDPLTKEPSSFACVGRSLEPYPISGQENESREMPFQWLFHHVPVGIALVDTTGLPIASNAFLQRMLGCSAEEIRRTPFAKFVHPHDLPDGRKLFLQLASGKIDHYQVHKRLVDRRGNAIQVRMTVTLMRGSAGEPRYSISMVERTATPQEGRSEPDDPIEQPAAHDDPACCQPYANGNHES